MTWKMQVAAANSCPAAGLGQDWVIAYARKIKEQNPVWVRGTSRAVLTITTAEQTLQLCPNPCANVSMNYSGAARSKALCIRFLCAMRFALELTAGRNGVNVLAHNGLRAEPNESLKAKVNQSEVVHLTQSGNEIRH
jgi:hypothetical protein